MPNKEIDIRDWYCLLCYSILVIIWKREIDIVKIVRGIISTNQHQSMSCMIITDFYPTLSRIILKIWENRKLCFLDGKY